MRTEHLLKILNTTFSRTHLLELLKFKTVTFEQSSTMLELNEFKIRPYKNTADILGITGNDDHYIGTIHAITPSQAYKILFS